jgi:hypothetical protein
MNAYAAPLGSFPSPLLFDYRTNKGQVANSGTSSRNNATNFMERYRMRLNYRPLTLYRVQYAGSMTQYVYPNSKELQAASLAVPQNEQEFKTMINKHLNWRCKDRSPFISTFSDREHAIKWGYKVIEKSWNRASTFTLLEYRISGPEAMIFSLLTLQRSLHVDTWDGKLANHEYLCLHRISSESFTRSSEYPPKYTPVIPSICKCTYFLRQEKY